MVFNIKNYLIIRILGNDIPIIHSDTQTYENLLFTVKNETNFENTDKIYLLNRIADKKKRADIINLLNEYSISYIEIPFVYDEFKKIPKLDEYIIRLYNYIININGILSGSQYKKVSKELFNYRIYLMNINVARNYCIEYGKKKGYEWTFVLDSNSFFTDEYYNSIIKNIKKDTEYISIPQIRLNDGRLINEDIFLSTDKLESLPEQEHQLGFKITSKYVFNKDLPYGSMNKAELLNALGIPGKWSEWGYDLKVLNLTPRKFDNVKYQILSKCIRLDSGKNNNNIKFNWKYRLIGVYLLINNIENEYKEFDKINKYYIITLLIGILIVLYIYSLIFNKSV